MPTDSGAGSARVCVIGSYAKALVMTADRIPAPGETLLGRDYRQTFGGKGSDMAVQAARLGARVSYVGVVGDDLFGREFVSLMEQEGVDVSRLRISDQRPTGVGFIIKDEAGGNVIVVDMGANELFDRSDIDRAGDRLGECDVALAQLEIPLDTALYGLSAAGQAGARTILNPAPAVDLRRHDMSVVDVITPNQTEARLLLGLAPESNVDDSEIARELLGLGVGAVAITRGDEGARLFERSADGSLDALATTVPPFAIELADSNGAGDSFNAGLAVGIAEGLDLPAAGRFAGAVAALCCEHWETVPSYQQRETVDAFLRAAQP
jgi:ribokinase